MKIIDKINARMEKGTPFFSFEFFPPKSDDGVELLFEKLDRLSAYAPVFCDITWGAGGSTADLTLDIAVKMQNMACVETMMHMTCTNMPATRIESALRQVREAGLQNILALRGDPPKGQEKFEVVEGGFSCALDLVRYIRKEFGNDFGIGVAGYPEAHPDKIVSDPVEFEANYWADLAYLKEKVEAGADFIVTQLFYDVEQFLKFVKDCRSIGINCPILPGIMPIMTYGGFKRMTDFCKTKVPAAISEKLETLKDNEEAVKEYGIHLGVEMCKRVLEAGIPGVHMYTLNLDKTALSILTQLGLIGSSPPRSLPWRSVPTGTTRALTERVRPVYWANRTKSYNMRTSKWSSFPTGRWAEAPKAFAAVEGSRFTSQHTLSEGRKEKAREAWGAQLAGVTDVIAVFEKYFAGEISILPWSESAGVWDSKAAFGLAALSKGGYLAINSLPAVNGAPSEDPVLSWGGAGGVVYQKSYVEFFCSPEAYEALLPRLEASPTLSFAAASATELVKSNLGGTTAISWGVFPGKEIVQPTVVDVDAFLVWRDEAFNLWLSDWGALYAPDSESYGVLRSIVDSWLLVSIVDHNYNNIHRSLPSLLG